MCVNKGVALFSNIRTLPNSRDVCETLCITLPGDSFALLLACAWADKWVKKKAAGAGSLFLGSPCYPAAGNGVRAKVYSSDSSAAMLTGILAGTI